HPGLIRIRLAFTKVCISNEQEKIYYADKINNITRINNPATDTAVMKINTYHFNKIIGPAAEYRQPADGTETIIKQCAGNYTGDKCNHRIICKTAHTNTDGGKNSSQEKQTDIRAYCSTGINPFIYR